MKKSIYDKPSTSPGIASVVIAIICKNLDVFPGERAEKYAVPNAQIVQITDVNNAIISEFPR